MLTSILQSANILGWVKVFVHHMRLTKTSKRHVLPAPPLLTSAISTLSLLLLLSYLTSAFDVWFHASSEGYVVTTSKSQVLSDHTMFGRQINETRCAYYANLWANIQPDNQLCGLLTGFFHTDVGKFYWPPDTHSIGEASRSLTNTSSVNQVVFTSDQEAILVPAVIPPAVSFDAVTTGVKTSCKSCVPSLLSSLRPLLTLALIRITNQCIDPTQEPPFAPIFNCTGEPRVIVNNSIVQEYYAEFSNLIYGVIDPEGYMSGVSSPEWSFQAANAKSVSASESSVCRACR